MRKSFGSIAALALLAHLPGVAVQAAAPHPCTQERDDTARLACYDQAFGPPAAPKPLPDPPPLHAQQLPEKFSATVTKLEWRNGLFVVTLDNDQVWIQSERDSRVLLANGDTVNFRRASLGSWLMSSNQGIAARVKRLR